MDSNMKKLIVHGFFPLNIITIFSLLFAIIGFYDSYILVKWLMFISSLWLCYDYATSTLNKVIGLSIIFGAFAALYNPIMPVFLNRGLWCIADGFAIFALIYSMYEDNQSLKFFSNLGESSTQYSKANNVTKSAPYEYSNKPQYANNSKKKYFFIFIAVCFIGFLGYSGVVYVENNSLKEEIKIADELQNRLDTIEYNLQTDNDYKKHVSQLSEIWKTSTKKTQDCLDKSKGLEKGNLRRTKLYALSGLYFRTTMRVNAIADKYNQNRKKSIYDDLLMNNNECKNEYIKERGELLNLL